MMGHYRHLFNALRGRHGEWTLFAVLRRPRKCLGRWNVVVAAPWMPQARMFDDTRLILATLHEVATPQQVFDSGAFILTNPDQIAATAGQLLAGRPIDRPVGRVRRRDVDFHGLAYSRGYVWAANLPAAVPAA